MDRSSHAPFPDEQNTERTNQQGTTKPKQETIEQEPAPTGSEGLGADPGTTSTTTKNKSTTTDCWDWTWPAAAGPSWRWGRRRGRSAGRPHRSGGAASTRCRCRGWTPASTKKTSKKDVRNPWTSQFFFPFSTKFYCELVSSFIYSLFL